MKPEIGDKMETWFSCNEDSMSTVLGIRPYVGKYTQWFSWIVKVTAPSTRRGWMEMTVGPGSARRFVDGCWRL